MKKAPFFRLVSVIGLVAFMAVIFLMFLRYLGSQAAYAPPPHPWMDRAHWLAARLAPEDCSQIALEQLLELGDQWFVWVDVQPDQTRQFQLVCPEKKIFEIRAPVAKGPTLTRVLPLLKKHGVIFNLRTTDQTETNAFLKLLDGWDDKKDVGLASPSQSIIRDLRKQRPQWMFAADAATWTKLKFFAAFGIETTVDLWPDFFVASQDPDEPSGFTKRTAAEIDRRGKIVMLELNDDDKIDPSWKEHIRGILTTRPKNFSADTFFKKIGAK